MISPMYAHAPWVNDPYDTVLSFAMFFVPLVACGLFLQVSLCRRSEALLTVRVAYILRACRVAVGTILFDLGSSWSAVALRANSTEWTLSATGAEIGLLVAATGAALLAAVHLARAPRLLAPAQIHDAHAPDWIGDAVTVAKRESHWFGPLRPLVTGVATWTERVLELRVRRHPVMAAAIVSATFGVVVFAWQGYREGYFLSVTLLAMGLGSCAMFAFLIPAGRYFGLVRSENPSSGARRRLLEASVVACATAIGTLAFRGSLWSLIGTSGNSAGPAQFATLEGVATLAGFVATLLVTSILSTRAKAAR